MGRINFSVVWSALLFRRFISSVRISPAWVMHRSHMCAPSPAMSLLASCFRIPQNEQVTSFMFFAILFFLFGCQHFVYHAMFFSFRRGHPVVAVRRFFNPVVRFSRVV